MRTIGDYSSEPHSFEPRSLLLAGNARAQRFVFRERTGGDDITPQVRECTAERAGERLNNCHLFSSISQCMAGLATMQRKTGRYAGMLAIAALSHDRSIASNDFFAMTGKRSATTFTIHRNHGFGNPKPTTECAKSVFQCPGQSSPFRDGLLKAAHPLAYTVCRVYPYTVIVPFLKKLLPRYASLITGPPMRASACIES